MTSSPWEVERPIEVRAGGAFQVWSEGRAGRALNRGAGPGFGLAAPGRAGGLPIPYCHPGQEEDDQQVEHQQD